MKRLMAYLLFVVLLLSVNPAHANSWGLKGELYSVVSDVRTWNDYTTYGNQSGDAAVMQSRYHNALMMVEEGELHVYTTAVWQPDHDHGTPKVTQDGDKLTLAYGNEIFSFVHDGNEYMLDYAEAGNLTVWANKESTYWRYFATDGYKSYRFRRQFPLNTFNISLFPRELGDVMSINHLQASLDTGTDVLGWWGDEKDFGRKISKAGKGTVPVYSAPFGKSAWRAASGKAAVSLKDDLWLLRTFINQDGEAWACIRYEVSQRTQRIGFIEAEKLGKEAAYPDSVEDMINVQLQTVRDTYITDDPLCSQFAQIKLPANTFLTCIGMLNDDYAYVSLEVRNSKVSDGGQIMWGFVPLRDLSPVYSPKQQDVMDAMAGYWYYEAGGSMGPETLILNADGSFIGNNAGMMNFSENSESIHGRWSVRLYSDTANLYWNDPPYEIVFDMYDGRSNVKGLTFEGDTFSLTNWEGGGGYRRVPESELTEDMLLPEAEGNG